MFNVLLYWLLLNSTKTVFLCYSVEDFNGLLPADGPCHSDQLPIYKWANVLDFSEWSYTKKAKHLRKFIIDPNLGKTVQNAPAIKVFPKYFSTCFYRGIEVD